MIDIEMNVESKFFRSIHQIRPKERKNADLHDHHSLFRSIANSTIGYYQKDIFVDKSTYI